MTLFRNTKSFIPHLVALVTIVLLGTNSQSALADKRGSDRHHDFPDRYDNHWNTGADRHRNRDRHYLNRHNSRKHYRPAYRRNFGYDNFSRRARRWDNNWSVSLNLGNTWAPGYSLGHNTYRPFRVNRNRIATSVIYNSPTVVYMDNPDVSRNRIVNRPSDQSGKSGLLRDIHGNCFERSYDGYGNETRIQLPNAACNF